MAICVYAKQPENLFTVNGRIGKRDKYDLDENETSSVIDQSKVMIKHHIDKRIALFFQQLVVCYDVPFHFEIGETQHQAKSAPTMTKKEGTETLKVDFNSAHSATIPCLYAQHKEDWDNWKADPDTHPKPQAFAYPKGSDTYNQHNSTLELIKLVNSADISLDGTSTSTDQLRVKSIKLINHAAQGTLTSGNGLKKFLKIAKKVLEDKMASRTVKAEIKEILQIYLERVESAIAGSQEGEFFDQLLNLKINDESEDAAKLRKLIYKRRFSIIRQSQETQSVIAKKISVASAEILGIKRRPASFCKLLKKKILTLCTSNEQRRQLTRLFNVSIEQLTHDLQGKRVKTAQTLLNSTQHTQKFNNLMRTIRSECHSLVGREYTFRANVTRDLRNYKEWRQVDLVREYKNTFNLSISQPTISRIENTIKRIEPDLADRLAIIFEVDPGFFFPAIFTSVKC